MIPELALAGIMIISGWASQYAPGVMERVIAVRQVPGRTAHDLPIDLPQVDGYVATADCNEIGTILWLRPIGQEQWESFLVADCAGADSYGWMVNNNILVEVDYETAVRWDTVGRGQRIERRVEEVQ